MKDIIYSEAISSRMISLGYDKSIQQGCCFGLSMLAQSAFLLDELKLFNERLLRICSTPLDKFKEASAQIKQDAIFSSLEDNIQEAILFFDPIFFYQNHTYIDHNGLITDITQSEMEKEGFLLPLKLQNNLFRLEKFSGVYNLIELEQYFDLMRRAFLCGNISRYSLLLESGDHAIHIGFNKDENSWVFVDSNFLPIKKFDNTAHLAEQVFKSFDFNEFEFKSKEEAISIFSTGITVLMDYKDELTRVIAGLGADEVWRQLHQVTPEKAICKDSLSFTWLSLTSGTGELELAKKLLSQPRIKVNRKAKNGSYPLHRAIHYKNIEMVELLLHSYEDYKSLVPRKKADNAFVLACLRGYYEIIELFMRHKDVKTILDLVDELGGMNALQISVLEDKKPLFDMILEKIALFDVNHMDDYGDSVLNSVCQEGNYDMLLELCRIPGIDLNLGNKFNRTPFMQACIKGHLEIVKYLATIEQIDVNATGTNDKTAFMLAIEKNQIEVINFLLTLPTLNLDLEDCEGNDAFFYACKCKNFELIIALIDKEGHLTYKNSGGVTRLDNLICHKDWESIQFIIEHLKTKNQWQIVFETLSDHSKQILSPILNRRISFFQLSHPEVNPEDGANQQAMEIASSEDVSEYDSHEDSEEYESSDASCEDGSEASASEYESQEDSEEYESSEASCEDGSEVCASEPATKRFCSFSYLLKRHETKLPQDDVVENNSLGSPRK